MSAPKPPPAAGVKAVLFDLDGTLCSADPAVDADRIRDVQLARLSARLRSWAVEFEGLEPSLRLFWTETYALERRANPRLKERDFGSLLGRVLRGQGLRLSGDQASLLWQDLYIRHPDSPKQLAPDALITLSRLRERGLKVGVITNRPWPAKVFLPELEALGVGRYVDTVTSSGDVGFRKPHRRVFEQALGALGLAPNEAIMVGDSLRNDVLAAKRCGIGAVWKVDDDSSDQGPKGVPMIRRLYEIFDTGLL